VDSVAGLGEFGIPDGFSILTPNAENRHMLKLTNYLEKKYAGSKIDTVNLQSVNLISSPKHNLMGISLGDEFIMLNVKYYFSFRFKLYNVGYFKPFDLFASKQPFDKEYLKQYFSQNQDNPYAIQNVMNVCVHTGKVPADLTQFPPLYIKKEDKMQNMKRIYNEARIGDSIFTFNRDSVISRLIRKYDKGMWSHVGIVADMKRNIYEVTTSGASLSDFSSLYGDNLDVGLYRPKGEFLSPSDKQLELQLVIATQLKKGVRFDWKGIFLIFLRKRFGIPVKRITTPADIICANQLQLMCYA
jgi:hypothetical protein